jgi:hypothetical protein
VAVVAIGCERARVLGGGVGHAGQGYEQGSGGRRHGDGARVVVKNNRSRRVFTDPIDGPEQQQGQSLTDSFDEVLSVCVARIFCAGGLIRLRPTPLKLAR